MTLYLSWCLYFGAPLYQKDSKTEGGNKINLTFSCSSLIGGVSLGVFEGVTML